MDWHELSRLSSSLFCNGLRQLLNARRGRTKVDNSATGGPIYFADELDLATALCQVFLVDANRISPDIYCAAGFANVSSRVVQVSRDPEPTRLVAFRQLDALVEAPAGPTRRTAQYNG